MKTERVVKPLDDGQLDVILDYFAHQGERTKRMVGYLVDEIERLKGANDTASYELEHLQQTVNPPNQSFIHTSFENIKQILRGGNEI